MQVPAGVFRYKSNVMKCIHFWRKVEIYVHMYSCNHPDHNGTFPSLQKVPSMFLHSVY